MSDSGFMAQLKSIASNDIAPMKLQSEDPGEQLLECVSAVLGFEYVPPRLTEQQRAAVVAALRFP